MLKSHCLLLSFSPNSLLRIQKHIQNNLLLYAAQQKEVGSVFLGAGGQRDSKLLGDTLQTASGFDTLVFVAVMKLGREKDSSLHLHANLLHFLLECVFFFLTFTRQV